MPIDTILGGVQAGSVTEVYIYNALAKYEIPFDYQVPLFGGKSVSGGQVLDFLVYIPYKQPIQTMGPHWHTGHLGVNDAFKLARISSYYGRETLVVWSFQVDSQEDGFNWVKKNCL